MKTNLLRTIGATALSICALFSTYSTTAQSVNVVIPNTGMNSFNMLKTHAFADPLPVGAILTSASISGTVASSFSAPGFYTNLTMDLNTDALGAFNFELTGMDIAFGPLSAATFPNYVYGGSNNFNYQFIWNDGTWKGATITLNYITSCNIAPPVVTSATATSNVTILVDWNTVAGANFYEVQYREKGTSAFTSNIVSSAVTSYSLTGLTPGTVYQIRVRSMCANAIGFASNWRDRFPGSTTITNGPQACDELANLNPYTTAPLTTGTQLSFSYNYPTNATGVRWEIRTSDNSYRNEGNDAIFSTGPNSADKTFTGLTPSTRYYVYGTTICGAIQSFGAAKNFTGMTSPVLVTGSGLNREAANNANVYPNPTRDILNLEVSTISENATATIMAIDGKVMKVVSLNNNMKSEINVSDLSNGVYMIRIQNGSDISTQKFVKQ